MKLIITDHLDLMHLILDPRSKFCTLHRSHWKQKSLWLIYTKI